MNVDDRLETVLRTRAAGTSAARIRYAQVIDLLGRLPDTAWEDRHHAALASVEELSSPLPDADKAQVLRTSAIRSVHLVRHLANEEPTVAAAALAAARLLEDEWLALIPSLPIRARGFLRHRRDLGPAVEGLLRRLGIDDFALPLPPGYIAEVEDAALPVTAIGMPARTGGSGIGAIVRRIEAFRRARSEPPDSSAADPRLPFGDEPVGSSQRLTEIPFRTDEEGAVAWVEGPAQALWGSHPFTAEADAPVRCDLGTLRAVKGRAPIREGRVELAGAAAIAGAWRIDAIPLFADRGGRFTGYIGRLRRPEEEAPALPKGSDRLRQLLHELRTPVNAIQGFAELIQQQLFGPTPHEYRSLAASIAADAARILGGFEDIDRLVRLETGHLSPDEGATDLSATFARLLAQLEPIVAPREVRLRIERPDDECRVGIEELDLERMLWRILAVIGSAAQPGERLRFALHRERPEGEDAFVLVLPLPAALASLADEILFAPDSTRAAAFPSTAMLGSGFALRLAAAEIRAAGGRFVREGAGLVLSLPGLPERLGNHISDIGLSAGGAAGN